MLRSISTPAASRISPNWYSVAAAARPVYELYSAGDKLIVKHPDCPHRFPPEMREESYRLIEQTLRP